MGIFSSEFSVPHGNGYRFYPTKEELFSLYLRPAVNGEPLSSKALVELEIYGDNKEPWKIFDKDAKHSFWVITKLKKKSRSRIDRTAGCGCWLGRSMMEVQDEHGQVLGFDKYFTFTCKKNRSNRSNGRWIMHEFSLIDQGLNDYVICEIKNKDAVKPKNKKFKTLKGYDEEMSLIPTVNKVRVENNLNQVNLDERNGSRTLNYQKKFGNLDDKKNHDLNMLQTPTPISTIYPTKDSVCNSKGNDPKVNSFLSKFDLNSVPLEEP